MRINIREQLSLIVAFVALCCVGVPSLISWSSNYRLVVEQRTSRLALIADFKSQQLAQSVSLLRDLAGAVATRVELQSALRRYNEDGNNTYINWESSLPDLSIALNAQPYLLHATLWDRNLTRGLLNVTSQRGQRLTGLPFGDDTVQGGIGRGNLTGGFNWQGHKGFPDYLYPRSSDPKDTPMERAALFTPELILSRNGSGIFLGPVQWNATYYMCSFTIPVVDSVRSTTGGVMQQGAPLLGFLTVVMNARVLTNVVLNAQNLDPSEAIFVLGPNGMSNIWIDSLGQSDATVEDNTWFKISLPSPLTDRLFNFSLQAHQFPTLKKVYAMAPNGSAENELRVKATGPDGTSITFSVGYRHATVPMTDWALIVAQGTDEVLKPVVHLRNVLLAVVFGAFGIVIVFIFILADFFVRPIKKLEKASKPKKKKFESPFSEDEGPGGDAGADAPTNGHAITSAMEKDLAAENGFVIATTKDKPSMWTRFMRRRRYISPWQMLKRRRRSKSGEFDSGHHDSVGGINGRRTRDADNDDISEILDVERAASASDGASDRQFRIPSKVPETKHWVRDELTDLTHTFNEMVEELEGQYVRLEERVRERTKQLDEQRQLAEIANEAKTRFIANITHELRTPLNGILGMCAVCLAEDDIDKMKQSLGIVHKSGELLLHLLTDLLTFSRVQVKGRHNVTLENRRFSIADISSQVMAIFEKQAHDGHIALKTKVLPDANVKDMVLWGDSNRILQIIINLISNGLKFTPEGGSVSLQITRGREIKSRQQSSSSSDPASAYFHERRQASSQSPPPRTRRSGRGRPRATPTQSVSSSQDAHSPSPGPHGSPGLPPTSHASHGSHSYSQGPPCRSSSLNDASLGLAPASTTVLDSRTYAFEFEVRDTGPGIPESDQQKIFEPFVQGDLGLNRRFGGTGLGLSICKELATLMKGTLTLDSTEGVGSAFKLTIPLVCVGESAHSVSMGDLPSSVGVSLSEKPVLSASIGAVDTNADSNTPSSRTSFEITPVGGGSCGVPGTGGGGGGGAGGGGGGTNGQTKRFSAQIAKQPRLVGLSQPFFAPAHNQNSPPLEDKYSSSNNGLTNSTTSPGTGPRVLVAEDNKINQEVVLRMLKLESIEDVTLAADGQEAVDKIQEAIDQGKAFNIVFMDVQMPNLDGLESTRIIRKLGYSAPIVALSAFSDESNVKECLESGMNFFLSKPIRRPALKQVLRTYCTPIGEEEEVTSVDGGKKTTTVSAEKTKAEAEVKEKEINEKE